MQTRNILALAGIIGGAAWMAMRQAQQNPSGGGMVGTADPAEGSIMDLAAVANAAVDAATPAPAGQPDTMSLAGIKALQQREGFSATPYPDHKGQSIGFGHLIKPGENLTFVSVQQATDLLMGDITWAEAAVLSAITVPITQGQFDALVSFCYNVGAPQFRRSTLVRRINAGDPNAGDEFKRWIYASGQVDTGLVARRQSELDQWEAAA